MTPLMLGSDLAIFILCQIRESQGYILDTSLEGWSTANQTSPVHRSYCRQKEDGQGRTVLFCSVKEDGTFKSSSSFKLGTCKLFKHNLWQEVSLKVRQQIVKQHFNQQCLTSSQPRRGKLSVFSSRMCITYLCSCYDIVIVRPMIGPVIVELHHSRWTNNVHCQS